MHSSSQPKLFLSVDKILDSLVKAQPCHKNPSIFPRHKITLRISWSSALRLESSSSCVVVCIYLLGNQMIRHQDPECFGRKKKQRIGQHWLPFTRWNFVEWLPVVRRILSRCLGKADIYSKGSSSCILYHSPLEIMQRLTVICLSG